MEDVPDRRSFGPDRIAMVPVIVFGLGSLPVAASSAALNALVLLPIACAVWVLRARVVAAPVGVEVCNGLRVRRLAWSDVEGFRVPKRGPVRLLSGTGRAVAMTALPRRKLPELMAVADKAARAS